jgi:hypothetical protein
MEIKLPEKIKIEKLEKDNLVQAPDSSISFRYHNEIGKNTAQKMISIVSFQSCARRPLSGAEGPSFFILFQSLP